jgi:eukaryotic-like serine/threonine-protein kinase
MKRSESGNHPAVTTAEPAPEPAKRAVLGRYQLGPVIGVGSSAVVRKGRDLRDGGPVAIKMFHPASTHDVRQQRQEMEALSRLDHAVAQLDRRGGEPRAPPGPPTALNPILSIFLSHSRPRIDGDLGPSDES